MNELLCGTYEKQLSLPEDERSEDIESVNFIFMIFAFLLGTKFLFRGQQEYKDLCFDHFEVGRYGQDADEALVGLKYLERNGMPDKKTRLSLANNTLYNQQARRVVANFPDDEMSVLKWFVKV